MKFDRINKFAAAKIECSFEMGKVHNFGGNIYFAGDGTSVSSPYLYMSRLPMFRYLPLSILTNRNNV